MNNFKSQVFQAAFDLLEEKNKLLSSELKSLEHSINEDTKSSAGDKYETGREMIRQEIGKVENQFQQNKVFTMEMKHLMDSQKSSLKITEGSLVRFGEDWLFISVSIGQIIVGGEKVFLLSKNSPLGQELMGKEKGGQVSFRGKSKIIKELL
ncbi:hypothetical protein [Algoriphagus sp.]|uniref:hypothetical protein n=1 Tax=Algoriphagus sp. TaxID=1872435 RepID=UPI0025FDD3D7|nr:hypothetical protein [Algoriphagus sp.]